MNALDEPTELNRDALLATIYQIQADLKILTEQLARDRQMNLTDQTLLNLAYMHHIMQQAHPSLRRH